jgi:hypothetical protein
MSPDIKERFEKLDESLLAELLGLFSKNFNLIFTKNTPHIHVIEEDPYNDKFIKCPQR